MTINTHADTKRERDEPTKNILLKQLYRHNTHKKRWNISFLLSVYLCPFLYLSSSGFIHIRTDCFRSHFYMRIYHKFYVKSKTHMCMDRLLHSTQNIILYYIVSSSVINIDMCSNGLTICALQRHTLTHTIHSFLFYHIYCFGSTQYTQYRHCI